jgi:hypothetical protein
MQIYTCMIFSGAPSPFHIRKGVSMLDFRSSFLLFGVLLCGAALGGSASAEERAKEAKAAQSPVIVITPDAPADIPGGAPNADLTTAAAFAWQEFIALSWPAYSSLREAPDRAWPFGAHAAAGGPPLVWQTFRHKIETFPSREPASVTVSTPVPQGYDPSKPSNGYDAPPAYFYVPSEVGTSDGSVLACPGQTPPTQPVWVNLDEITQIGLDQMFAGVLPPGVSGANTAPQLIRFMAKGNRAQFNYVTDSARQAWYHSPWLQQAETNFTNAIASGSQPQGPFVDFPAGTIELKSAWRPLAPGEDPSRFHTTTVRFYETSNNLPCYVDAQWALIALHIIQRTPSTPYFVFATFEQADNLPAASGQRVEDENGSIIAPQSSPTEPSLFYLDLPASPIVLVSPFYPYGQGYCTSPGQRLFFHEIASNSALPSGGDICVNQRFHAIPPAIVNVNAAAHSAIIAYEQANRVTDSPWRYYKLVNVQAYPFDKSQIDYSNPDSPRGVSTFYQANSVVETDYGLQNFEGRLKNGAPTDYKPDGTYGFKNVYRYAQSQPVGVDMGGCQGCHGNAQVGGTAFSFILDGNGFQPSPDRPTASVLAAAAKKFRERFAAPTEAAK